MNFKQTAIKAAKEAGKILSKYYCKDIQIKVKPGDSYVTKADIESSHKIRKIILNQFPDHNIIDEELGNKHRKSDYCWIVDPLDGTHNFIMDNPLFGVSIALQYKEKIILGVIYFPILKKLYYAEKGKGAFYNGKRIKVSNKIDLKKSLFIFDTKLGTKTKLKLNILKKLSKLTWRIRAYGAAIYHNICIADGKAEFNIDFDSNPWDHSAVLLMVEEAGGKVTDLNRKKWDADTKDYVASNKNLHNKVLSVLKK